MVFFEDEKHIPLEELPIFFSYFCGVIQHFFEVVLMAVKKLNKAIVLKLVDLVLPVVDSLSDFICR
jgi:hypothetical protein